MVEKVIFEKNSGVGGPQKASQFRDFRLLDYIQHSKVLVFTSLIPTLSASTKTCTFGMQPRFWVTVLFSTMIV